ncbi:MFS transporter [Peribacillus kribbensis]|uniref:MFS transporter n=1 Tax=Peribacillus kribbensis TaxID=356658 RepID=UPI001C5A4070|nr:MFS transporter [Peribacillus kribbensis]
MRQSGDSLFKQSSFTKFWTSRILSSTSSQMLSVAIGWQMYEVTKDAFSLGMVGLAQFLPMVLLTFVVGHVADRYERRRIVYICQIIDSLVAGLLLWGSIEGWIGREQILAAAAILGVTRSFEGTSASSLLPQLIEKKLLQQAISISTTAGQTSQILGPMVGGLLYGVGAGYVYGTASAALLIGAVMTYLIRLKEQPVRSKEPVTLRSVFLGLEFVIRHPLILGTISLDLFAVLLGGATALLPIFAKDILHAGPLGLGLLRTAPAIGALIVSLILAYYPLKKAIGMKLFAALAVFGLATMLFAVSTNLVVSVIALLLIGGSDVISVVIRSSLVQLQTPDEMRGRVNAVNSLFIGTSNQLGEFESGTVAGFTGAVPAALIGGVGTIIVAGLWMYLFPSLRKIRSLAGN